MVGHAKNQGAATGLDDGDRYVPAQRLARNHANGTPRRSGTTTAEATREACREQQQSHDDGNRKDQSQEDDG